MKPFLPYLYFVLLFIGFACNNPTGSQTDQKSNADMQLLGQGRQPQIATDKQGVVHVTYGHENDIYYTTSGNNGERFSEPVLVGTIENLLLGMSMGPQIAVSANYKVITAIDKKGNIHAFAQQEGTDTWVKIAGVNDVPGVAAEGLMSLASDAQDHFYAVWLDVRGNKKNKIVMAASNPGLTGWEANKVVYQSPDSTVCECCKPNVLVQDNNIHIMFRNWLNGSRDFYITTSADAGKTFSAPEKVGEGTWKVEGCPMDGGGLIATRDNSLLTAWQRDGVIYTAQPGQPEKQVGTGRNCRISGGDNPVVSWKDKEQLKLRFVNSGKEQQIGEGSYLETATMPDDKTLCIWENDKKLYFKRI